MPVVACVMFFACLLDARIVLGQGVAAGSGSQPHPDSIARLMAGLPPSRPSHELLAGTGEWREHSRAIRASWSRVRDGQLAAMTAWRDTELPRQCPVGSTLLYPFSGPDFLNAYWLFPQCSMYVLFGLEPVGEVPDVDAMTPRQFAQFLADVRSAMINLFMRNYFVTGTMSKQLRTERLRGVVPLLMVSMALSGMEVLRIAPLRRIRAGPGPGAGPPAARRPARELDGVTFDFRSVGSERVQQLRFFSLDATNRGLAEYPEFLDYLRGLAPTTTLIKSASYLLHGSGFSRMRDALIEASEFLVQDDTGLPYALLPKRGWEVRLYGHYDVPITPFEYAFQPALASAYLAASPAALPFRFGYQRDRGEIRSNAMVGRRGPAGSRTR